MYVRDTQIIFDISMRLTFLHMSRTSSTMGWLSCFYIAFVKMCAIIARVKPPSLLVSKLCNR